MATVLRSGGYRLFFYSNEGSEPAHVHVRRGGFEAKFWLWPVSIARNEGSSAHELGRIRGLVQNHALELRASWNEYHDPDVG